MDQITPTLLCNGINHTTIHSITLAFFMFTVSRTSCILCQWLSNSAEVGEQYRKPHHIFQVSLRHINHSCGLSCLLCCYTLMFLAGVLLPNFLSAVWDVAWWALHKLWHVAWWRLCYAFKPITALLSSHGLLLLLHFPVRLTLSPPSFLCYQHHQHFWRFHKMFMNPRIFCMNIRTCNMSKESICMHLFWLGKDYLHGFRTII